MQGQRRVEGSALGSGGVGEERERKVPGLGPEGGPQMSVRETALPLPVGEGSGIRNDGVRRQRLPLTPGAGCS